MKFIVSSGALLKQLQVVGGVLNNSNTVAILDNFLFSLKGDRLEITASDLESTICAALTVQGDEDGEAAIPARLLLDGLKALPEQPVTLHTNADQHTVEISSDHGRYALAFVDADEFPSLPELEDHNTTVMPPEILATAIHKTLFAAGNDDMRPVMSGVFFQFDSEGLTFVATDAHKLVRYRRNDHQSPQTAEFIMPRKPLAILKSVLPSVAGEVNISYTETNARFAFDETVLICRLIDGKYPNYEAVIPKDNPNRLEVDRASMLSAAKRVALFSNKTTHQIRLKMAGSELQLSAEDIDFSNKAQERLRCNFQGEDMEIGFNARFLNEMLGNLESELISLELSAPNRAGLIFPVDGLEEGEDVLMLVMPVMLTD